MCDVCSTEHNENLIKCRKCGYANEFGIASFWFDKEDAQKWYKDVIKPHRMEWQLKVMREQQAEFSAQMLKAIKFMASKINVLFEKQEKFDSYIAKHSGGVDVTPKIEASCASANTTGVCWMCKTDKLCF